MVIKSLDLRAVEPCEEIQALKGRHTMKFFGRVGRHLNSCNKCKPLDFLLALQNTRQLPNRKKRFDKGVSKTTCRFAFRLYKQFGHTDTTGELQQAYAWFIIHTFSYDAKVETSAYLTQDQVVESIYQMLKIDVQRNDYTPHWPTHSYRNKWANYTSMCTTKENLEKKQRLGLRGVDLKKSVTRQEIANDLIYEKAACLNIDDLRTSSKEDFFKIIGIAEVING